MTHELLSEVNDSELDHNPFSMSDGDLPGTRRALIRLVGEWPKALQPKVPKVRPRNPLAPLFPRPERESAEA